MTNKQVKQELRDYHKKLLTLLATKIFYNYNSAYLQNSYHFPLSKDAVEYLKKKKIRKIRKQRSTIKKTYKLGKIYTNCRGLVVKCIELDVYNDHFVGETLEEPKIISCCSLLHCRPKKISTNT